LPKFELDLIKIYGICCVTNIDAKLFFDSSRMGSFMDKQVSQEWKKKVSILPIVLVCFFAMTTGSLKIFGIPVLFALPCLISAFLCFKIEKWDDFPTKFVACLTFAMLPGGLFALTVGRISMLPIVSLLVSFAVFIIVAQFTKTFLDQPHERAAASVNLTLKIFAVICILEILNYDTFCNIRLYYYSNSSANIVCQTLRSDALYLFPRPTAFFSEPSNFARFISLIVTLYAYVSKSAAKTIGWFFFFLLLTQSPTYLYCVPPLAIVLFTMGPSKEGKRQVKAFRRILVVLGLVAGLGGGYFIQNERIARATSVQSDGSFEERLRLPLQFVRVKWENPVIGSGPTPGQEINSYVYRIYIYEQGRFWLDADTYKGAFSSAIGLFVAMGVLGLLLFLTSAYISMGSAGLTLISIFMLINLMAAGMNSPAMYVPSAIMVSVTWLVLTRSKSLLPT
jgi:hypothetical protein